MQRLFGYIDERLQNSQGRYGAVRDPLPLLLSGGDPTRAGSEHGVVGIRNREARVFSPPQFLHAGQRQGSSPRPGRDHATAPVPLRAQLPRVFPPGDSPAGHSMQDLQRGRLPRRDQLPRVRHQVMLDSPRRRLP